MDAFRHDADGASLRKPCGNSASPTLRTGSHLSGSAEGRCRHHLNNRKSLAPQETFRKAARFTLSAPAKEGRENPLPLAQLALLGSANSWRTDAIEYEFHAH